MLRSCLLFLLFLLLAVPALADTAFTQAPDAVIQGDTARFAFTYDGEAADLTLMNAAGAAVGAVSGYQHADRVGVFVLDGSLTPGAYVLRLSSGESMAQKQFTVIRPAILSLDAAEELTDGWLLTAEVNAPGELVFTDADERKLGAVTVDAGLNDVSWPGAMPGEGTHIVSVCLHTASGAVSASAEFTVRLPERADPAHDTVYFTPADLTGVSCDHENCYWKLNMGEMDETAVWQVLTQPVTVIDGDERHQCRIRREPSSKCKEYTGEVTYASQAVHVLERGSEWTLIEAYSSSVEGSPVAVWVRPFTGYVETKKLKEVPVSQHVGIVIDKLQQRLYVFRDGALYSTLLCSTGFARADTPFNETPAGEFLALSWTGGFWSGSLYCDLAIRINDGILLHEVPCTVSDQSDGTQARSYERCERYLGEKASHGCIRIQRAQTPEHVNQKWLWDNLPRTGPKAKVIIWDDAGRTLDYPGGALTLYYNPNGGKNYHSSAFCAAVNERHWPLTPFPYADLDTSPFDVLTPCPACAPQLRHAGIDTVNQKNGR